MEYFMSIDSGTTNTRLFLICGDRIIDLLKLSVGARNTLITGSNSYLKEKIKEGINIILEKNKLAENDISFIIASGMITSSLGLCEVIHKTAPVGYNEIADSLVKKEMSDICKIPIYFVAGVKNFEDNDDKQDMMRGEETETLGIMSKCQNIKDMLFVLPGSHLKIIIVKDGKIQKCFSSLLGEASRAILENTVLKDSFSLTKDINFDAMTEGFNVVDEYGLTMSLFKIRSLKNFENKDNVYLSSYFNGVIMRDDVRQIVKISDSQNLPIIVGGSSPVKDELAYLINCHTKNNVTVLDDEITEKATAIGAIEISKRMR